jgi:hypothetical protein
MQQPRPRLLEASGVHGEVGSDDGDDSGGSRTTARSGSGLECTVWGDLGCVRKLGRPGAKRTHGCNARGTGASSSSTMAASLLGIHGGFG